MIYYWNLFLISFVGYFIEKILRRISQTEWLHYHSNGFLVASTIMDFIHMLKLKFFKWEVTCMKCIKQEKMSFISYWKIGVKSSSLWGELSIITPKALATLHCKGERTTIQNNTHAKHDRTWTWVWVDVDGSSAQ